MSLKIIGQHEENTVKQARNVLAKGADKFVLCADGHQGTVVLRWYGTSNGYYSESVSIDRKVTKPTP